MSGAPAGAITAAEYARRCDPPMGKPAMSRLIKMGLPVYPGKDDHGRDCKFVVPAEADRWRASFCTPYLDGRTGRVRGVPNLAPRDTGPAPAPASAPETVAADRPRVEARRPTPVGAPPLAGGDQVIAVRIQEARAVSAEEEARRRTYQRQMLEGQLLDRQAQIAAHLAFVGLVASSLERMAGDHATKVAAAVGCTEHAAYLALRTIAESLREDLARAARMEAARLRLDAEAAA